MIHLWVRQLQPYTCCLRMDPAFLICSFFSDFRDLKQLRHKWDFTDISSNSYNTTWECFLTWNPDWTYSSASAGQKVRWSVVFHRLTRLLQIPMSEDWFNMEVGKFRSHPSLKDWGYYIQIISHVNSLPCQSPLQMSFLTDCILSCLLFLVEFQRSIASVVLMLSLASAYILLILFLPLRCSLLSGWLRNPRHLNKNEENLHWNTWYCSLAKKVSCVCSNKAVSQGRPVPSLNLLPLKLHIPLNNHRFQCFLGK